MFIDEKKIVSLEYIYYNNKSDGRYHKLRKVTDDVNAKLKLEERNQLGTKDYIADQSATNPHNAFAEKPTDFAEHKLDYLQEHKKKQKMRVGSLNPNSLLKNLGNKISLDIKQDEKDKKKMFFMEPEKRKNEKTG